MFTLNEKQIAVIGKYLKGEITAFGTSEEDMLTMRQVIKMAEKAVQDTKADFGEDLIIWYYDNYRKEQAKNPEM